jgi:DNA-binding response OmpR family regulator
MKQRLAYIDDNRSNLECIGLILSNDFFVETFQCPNDFLEHYNTSDFLAILVDIHMPVMDGFALYEKIIEHEKYNGCPIGFISSDDSEANRITSFSWGAVDFLDRSMNPTELLARVKSQILYFQKHRNIVELANLKLNLTILKAYLADEELKLTFIEFKLLCHLLKIFPERATKEELVDKVWSNGHVAEATIYTHTFNLNSKIEKWDYEVVTERGKGTMLTKKTVTA